MIKIILSKILLNIRMINNNNEKSIKMKIKMIKCEKNYDNISIINKNTNDKNIINKLN